jgi:hypothetical protein
MSLVIGIYLFLLIHRPEMREKHLYQLKGIFGNEFSLKDMNPEAVLNKPVRVANAMGLSGGRWRIESYGDELTVIQPITSTGLKIGLPKQVKKSFDRVINRLIKK